MLARRRLSLARGSWPFLLLAATGALAIFSSTLAKTPVLPLYATDLGANAAELGWVFMASTLPGILVSLPVGVLSDRAGRRTPLLVALFIFATAPWLYLLVQEVWQLTLVRFYHGFATAIFGTVANAAIAARYPQQRATRLSQFSSITLLGRSAAPFLGGALIALTHYEGVYLTCAISGGLALAVGMLHPAEKAATPRPTQASPTSVRRQLFISLQHPLMRAAALTEAVQFFAFGALEAFLTVYAASLGIPVAGIGVLLGAQLVAIIFLKPLSGRISDRHGRAPVILGGLLIGALSTACLPWAEEFLTLMAVSLGLGLGYAAVTSSTAALIGDLSRQEHLGAAMGTLHSLMDIGQALGPVMVGSLIAVSGFTTGFTSLAALMLLMALAFGVSVRARSR